MVRELKPVYNKQKSFYGKAFVIYKEDGTIVLQSYNTIVAEINENGAKIHGFHSQTTLRHIKDFLYQNGFKVGSKCELKELYM